VLVLMLALVLVLGPWADYLLVWLSALCVAAAPVETAEACAATV
jgi:hypothetical protein